MADLKCATVIPEVSGLEANQLTVGRHFYLNCQGSYDKAFDFTKAQFLVDETNKHVVKIFKAEARGTDSFDVDMTLYQAGKVQFPDLIISDGNAQFSLGKQEFEVISVLPKPDPQNPEPPKPFGFAVGSLHWPIAYTLIFVALVLAVILQSLALAARKQRWKKLNAVVESFEETPLAPDNQFYKTIRNLEKKEYPIDDVELAAKVYILRTYKVAIFDLSLKESVNFIKKKYPQLKIQRRQVYNIVKDLEVLKKQTDLTTEQKLKFIAHFYEFVARCEETKRQGLLT